MRRVLASLILLASIVTACGGEGGTGSTDGSSPASTAAAAETTTTTIAAVPAGPVTFEQAGELVVAELIGDSEPEMPVIVFGRAEPLQPGDVVTVHQPLPDEESRVVATVEEETFFFWIDDVAGAYFAHPVRFVLVDAATGDLTVTDDEWPAEVNGEGIWTDDEDYWDIDNWVYESGTWTVEAAGEPNAVLAAHHPAPAVLSVRASVARTEAIVINGWKPGQTHRGEMEYDVEAMEGALKGMGATTQTFKRIDRNKNRTDLAGAFGELRDSLRPGDTLFVYLTGHGARMEDGTTFADGITETQLKEWLSDFAPCVKIVVQIHACHSGGFLDSMQQVADLTMVSTDEAGFSIPDIDWARGGGRTWKPDPNPGDRGSENTSGMVEGLQEIAGSDERKAAINDRIAETGESFLQAAAAESFGHAIRMDFGAINGLTHPATRAGNADVLSCDPPPGGDYQCGVTIETDLRNHGPHIMMPETLSLGFMRLPDEHLRVDGLPPFVPVEGVVAPDGSFIGTGMGTVAGFDDIGVGFDAIISYGGVEGTYEMGTAGGLPGAESITYAVSCTREE